MPDIERIMASMENILLLSQHHNMFTLSQLSVATTHTLAHNRLVQVLPAIQHDYPQLPINVIEGTNAQILQMVQERDADFAWFSASDLTPYNPLLRGVSCCRRKAGRRWRWCRRDTRSRKSRLKG